MTRQERIVHLSLTVTRLRKALQKIADLPLRDRKEDIYKPACRVRARRIAIAALKTE